MARPNCVLLSVLFLLWMTLMAPKAPPIDSEPVSPMKTMAGGALNQRKPKPAPQSVIRFWIIAAVLALIGLATLKLR